MTLEVEVKARLHHPAQIETELANLGDFEKETLKEDVYFRRRGDTSDVPADRYRLRKEEGKATVTFKQDLSRDGIEVNEEVEFVVDDPFAFFYFCDRFGFEPFVVKRKKSRVYRVGQTGVEFNEVEHLGHFVEIERLCDDPNLVLMARTEVARLLTDLGLPAEAVKSRSYIEMLQEAHPVSYRFINDRTMGWPFEEVV